MQVNAIRYFRDVSLPMSSLKYPPVVLAAGGHIGPRFGTPDYFCYGWLSEMCSYGMAEGCFTDVVLHSLNNYRDDRATERRHLGMEVVSTCGPEFLSFNAISRQYK